MLLIILPEDLFLKNMKNAKNYESINWEHCNIKLFKLQSEILKAYKTGVVADVLKAQYKLTRSFAARALAVRKVNTNKGKNTYGILIRFYLKIMKISLKQFVMLNIFLHINLNQFVELIFLK